MKKIILLFVSVLFYSVCFADQAAWITKQQADAACRILSKAGTVRHYCEPCGDKGYITETIRFVKSAKADEEYYEVSINDTPIDLAYIYVKWNGKWVNLAMLLQIEVSDVSRIMPAAVKKQGEKLHGSSNMKDFEIESR